MSVLGLQVCVCHIIVAFIITPAQEQFPSWQSRSEDGNEKVCSSRRIQEENFIRQVCTEGKVP